MTQKLVTLPLRVGFGLARTAVGTSLRLAGSVLGAVRGSGSSGSSDSSDSSDSGRSGSATVRKQPSGPGRPASGTAAATPTVRRTPAAPERSDPRVNGQPESPPVARTAPPPPAPVTPPAEQPDTPLTREQDAIKTVDDSDEVVAEVAEPGAEDGAGAQLDVDEPWKGYAQMKAGRVVERIASLDAAQLAVLELYERTHKKRQSVLNAAAKRLQSLSPPGTA
jgi:hypothetical protein